MTYKMPLLAVVCTSLCLFAACKPPDTPPTDPLVAKGATIAQLLEALHEKGQFNGAFFLANENAIVTRVAFGQANRLTGEPLTGDMTFDIASVSKPITATLILRLIEAGYLELESKVVDFFPALPYPEMTVRHLLTHTSGLPFYYEKLLVAHDLVGTEIDTARVLALYEEHQPPLAFASGTQFSYSNGGYMLLAMLAERATEQDFDTLLETYVFTPAKMVDTKRKALLSPGDKAATSHTLSITQGRYVPLDTHEHRDRFLETFFPDRKGPGSVHASLDDLWHFSQSIRSDDLLSPSTKAMAFIPAQLANGELTSYGLGWQLTEVDGSRFIHHRGGSEGGNCFYRIALNEGYTYFIVTNKKSYYLSQINQQILNVLAGKPVEPIPHSAAEAVALRLATHDDLAMQATINEMRQKQDAYTFALHEFNALAWSFWQREEYAIGLELIRLATVAMPKNAGAFEVLAEAYAETGEPALAIANYEHAIHLLHDDPSKAGKAWVQEWIEEMEGTILTLQTEHNLPPPSTP